MKLKDLFESTGRSVADLGIDYTGASNFNCSDRSLTSLVGSPKKVTGLFSCQENMLTSLKGAPEFVGDSFICAYNLLTSLEGAPKTVYGNFHCNGNRLTSLKDVHKHIHKVTGAFVCMDNPIRSHVLGLLLIEGITWIHIDNKLLMSILNKYLGKGRAGMLQAQEELIDVGFEEFAQL